MATMSENEGAFPVLLRRVKQEPEEDFTVETSLEDVESQLSQSHDNPETEADLNYIITTEDGEEIYDASTYMSTSEDQAYLSSVVTPKPKSKSKKRKSTSSESPGSGVKRRKRCGICGPCQVKENCGECTNCVRRSVLKQSCIYRKCIYLKKGNKSMSAPAQAIAKESQKPLKEFLWDAGLMADDTALLESPMVLLSPDGRDPQSPAVTNTVVSIPPTQQNLRQDDTSATCNDLPKDESMDISDKSGMNEHVSAKEDRLCSGGGSKSLSTHSPNNVTSDPEDTGIQSNDFFRKRILNDDDNVEPLRQPPGRDMYNQGATDPPRQPKERDVYAQGPIKPLGQSQLRDVYAQGTTRQSQETDLYAQEALRQSFLNRSFWQDQSQRVEDQWKKCHNSSKPLPSWKAFGSYSRPQENDNVSKGPENNSRRKNSVPRRNSKFADQNEEQDRKPNLLQNSDRPTQGSNNVPQNHPFPRYNHFKGDLDPAFLYAQRHAGLYMGPYSNQSGPSPYPNQYGPLPYAYGQEMQNSMNPNSRKSGQKRSPSPLADSARYMYPHKNMPIYNPAFPNHPIPPPFLQNHSFRNFTGQNGKIKEKLTPPLCPDRLGSPANGDDRIRKMPKLHRHTPPSNSQESGEGIKGHKTPPGTLSSSPYPYYNPYNLPDDMRYMGQGHFPRVPRIPSGADMFPRMPGPNHFEYPRFMNHMDSPREGYPFQPYPGPRMFSPWMPHGIPLGGPYPSSYPHLPPRGSSEMPRRPSLIRPPPPLQSHPKFRSSEKSADQRPQTSTPQSDTSSDKTFTIPKSPVLDKTSEIPSKMNLSGKPMDAHMKRYLDDVYLSGGCCPVRPASEPSMDRSGNSKFLDSSFEHEMISIDDFHVSAYIRADGANSVEIEFDESSLGDGQSTILSDITPISKRRRVSDPLHVTKPNCASNTSNVSSEKGSKREPKNFSEFDVGLIQDLGNGKILQFEIPKKDVIIENVFLYDSELSTSSNVQDLLSFITGMSIKEKGTTGSL